MRYKPHYLNSILIASASGSTKWSHNVTQVKKPTKNEEEKDKRFVLKINNYPYVFHSNIVLYKSFVSAIIYFFVDFICFNDRFFKKDKCKANEVCKSAVNNHFECSCPNDLFCTASAKNYSARCKEVLSPYIWIDTLSWEKNIRTD